MTPAQNDMTPRQAAEVLSWLAEMGADEVIGEMPVDRFAETQDSPTGRQPTPSAQPAPAATIAATSTRNGGGAAAVAAACATLDDIKGALQAFESCPLKRTATNLCFTDGNPKSPVLLVGEAPGRDEDIQGRPFVGRSGQLLDRMLAAIGLSRGAEDPERAVFITNTIFWRPPGNRDPTEAETLMCLPFVRRVIEVQRPRIIVSLGKISAQRLLESSEGILKLRGKWRSIEIGGSAIPLLPTLHPAYLLRQPAQKRLAWRDLLLLRQALDAH